VKSVTASVLSPLPLCCHPPIEVTVLGQGTGAPVLCGLVLTVTSQKPTAVLHCIMSAVMFVGVNSLNIG